MENLILEHRKRVAENIEKSFNGDLDIEKGVYKDNPLNRKLGRVGKEYGGKKDEIKTDRSGNYIGDGSFHSMYDIRDFGGKYPQISTRVDKSKSTESVYVTYYNSDTKKSVTLRFSTHENNAVKFGDQLNGNTASDDEVLYKLGLKERKFIPNKRLSVPFQMVKKKAMKDYEEAPLTIKEMYALGAGADLSKYKGKLAKDSNYLITGDKVEEFEEYTTNFLGQKVRVGKYEYQDL